jgi:hypothetical protein
MKKVTVIIVLVLFSSVFVTCNRNRPESVVEKYVLSFCNEDFEGIKNYVLPEHHSRYDFMQSIVNEDKKGDKAKKSQVQVKDIRCDIVGDTIAHCSCVIEESNGERKEEYLLLKKINNEWLVDQGKETMLSPEDNDFQREIEQISEMEEEGEGL